MVIILDRIRCKFHDVTVSFASCDIRVRRLRCTCWASRYWRFLIGAENENLTLAQLDPDRACHRDPVGRSAGRDWKARADRESLPINSAILCGHIGASFGNRPLTVHSAAHGRGPARHT